MLQPILQNYCFPAVAAALIFGSALHAAEYDHGDPTNAEQLVLQLMNRARANPAAEAARVGINLNQGLPAGTITPLNKPPLAFNRMLIAAARAHSQWMLDTDVVGHTGINGTSEGVRMEDAGYRFSGLWGFGENISWVGEDALLAPENTVARQHNDLVKSVEHRKNLMDPAFREIGLGARPGLFTLQGKQWNSVMLTEDFAYSDRTATAFITGVVYRDSNGNDFYDPGEGVPGVQVILQGQTSWTGRTSSSGGYSFPCTVAAGPLTIEFSGGTLASRQVVTALATGQNVQVDLKVTSTDTAPLKVSDVTITSNKLRFTVSGGMPGSATVESSVDLITWSNQASITLGSAVAEFSENIAAGGPTRYYRVRQ